jgi:CreA protein
LLFDFTSASIEPGEQQYLRAERHVKKLMIMAALLLVPALPRAEAIGSVDTRFKLIGPDHKVKVEAFDDEKIEGVACHISRAVTGGIKGAVGIAEDTSDASIACRQVGPIRIVESFDKGESAFSERRSLLFKRLKVARFCDEKRNTLVYLTYSERVVEGSPKNAISTVPILPWPGDEQPLAKCDDESDGWFD